LAITEQVRLPEIAAAETSAPVVQRLAALIAGDQLRPDETFTGRTAELLNGHPASPARRELRTAVRHALGVEAQELPAAMSERAAALVAATALDINLRAGHKQDARIARAGARVTLWTYGMATGAPIAEVATEGIKPESLGRTAQGVLRRAGRTLTEDQRTALQVLLGKPDPSAGEFLELLSKVPQRPRPSRRAAAEREAPDAAQDQRDEYRWRTTDTVGWYMKRISGELLDAAEEVRLAKAIEGGLYATHLLKRTAASLSPDQREELEIVAAEGTQAFHRFIDTNQRLVVSIVKKFQLTEKGKKLSFMSCVQEGNLGLVRAIEKFDYTKGYKFSTYATWWIRQSMDRAVASQGHTIELSTTKADEIDAMFRATRNWIKDHNGEAPTDEQLAGQLGITVESLGMLRAYNQQPVSINIATDTPRGDGREISGYIEDRDMPSPEEFVIGREDHELLHTVWERLKPKEARLLQMYLGFDGREYTPHEIAARLRMRIGSVGPRARQVLAKLRKDPTAMKILLRVMAS
jgi:RNA polymerase sigma factor (sigma-70 family)